ncbi:hypothetical protein DAPPUDRAFT_105600 [Daphnia pulex]|uniref:Ty3 transposon capsid-like protein domain-containing protein n=1 Tax=Daphnia pulex TaxID=6669 RepID=E9GR81_DAPPU|nr:hypothetical protein DAPPUDRAFT_105600 [Daphnia pulex]|eukprot:EFX78039.1 hypothetical protein DAPPUDRAFT_105600 [Daphnia pulex]
MTSTPPTPQTAPIQNPLNQRQGPRAPSPDPNNVPLTKSHLRELYSQDERKSIPVYKGKRGDQLINNWLKDAKRVAQSAGWNAKDKIKYFSDRLRGDAADWHSDYIDYAADKEDYDAWEKAIISRFLTETEIESLKKQLNELKQMPDQSTQTYVSRLNHLYDIIHGKEIVLDETIAPPEAVVLARSLRKIRGEAKQKILLKGLLPKIVQAVWTRINGCRCRSPRGCRAEGSGKRATLARQRAQTRWAKNLNFKNKSTREECTQNATKMDRFDVRQLDRVSQISFYNFVADDE